MISLAARTILFKYKYGNNCRRISCFQAFDKTVHLIVKSVSDIFRNWIFYTIKRLIFKRYNHKNGVFMKMKIRLNSFGTLTAGIILLCLFAFNATGQTRWKLVAVNSSHKNGYFVDENLRQKSNGNIIGWQKSRLPDNDFYPTGSYFVALVEWNCVTEQNRNLQFFIYHQSGSLIEKTEVDNSWKYITPESVGESTLKYVCGRFKKHRKKVKEKTNVSRN